MIATFWFKKITGVSFFMLKVTCDLQASRTWEGYILSGDSSTQGASTVAQQLLRKRYLGIQGSNKIIGALEVQQVVVGFKLAARSFMMAMTLLMLTASNFAWAGMKGSMTQPATPVAAAALSASHRHQATCIACRCARC